jgi:hypothetical protein
MLALHSKKVPEKGIQFGAVILEKRRTAQKNNT